MVEIVVAMLATFELEEYVACVMGAEMYPDWPERDHWPVGALMTQALLARSYALWRVEHPRTARFALYGFDYDQGVNCGRRHPKADAAVKATEGLIVTTGAADFVPQYVNKCGLDFCPVCKGGDGHDDKRWTGRACQYGMKHLADAGLDYLGILQFYYGCDAVVRRYDT